MLQYQHQQHQIPELRIVVIIIILESPKLRQSFKPICLSKREKYTTKPTQLKTACLESSKTHLPKKKKKTDHKCISKGLEYMRPSEMKNICLDQTSLFHHHKFLNLFSYRPTSENEHIQLVFKCIKSERFLL